MVKFLKVIVLVPVAVVILAFAIANRQDATVSFDPFASVNDPVATVTLPLFLVLFLTLVVGVIVGGVATWFTQGVNRHRARAAREDAERWRDEARRAKQTVVIPEGPAGRPAPGRPFTGPLLAGSALPGRALAPSELAAKDYA